MKTRQLVWRAVLWVLVNVAGVILAYILAPLLPSLLGSFELTTLGGFATFQFLFGGLFGLAIGTFQSMLLHLKGSQGRRYVIYTALGFSMGFFVANSMDLIVTGTENTLDSFVAGLTIGIWVTGRSLLELPA
jgi:hypothetical protein